MTTIRRTNSGNEDFIRLVHQLDADLKIRDGEEHDFYHQFNSIAKLNNVIVLYRQNMAVACGAIKEFAPGIMEVKRMYVLPENRNQGLATSILQALELWAVELGYNSCILETGIRQPEAIALYKKNSYAIIPNYGQYQNVPNSVCFQKEVK